MEHVRSFQAADYLFMKTTNKCPKCRSTEIIADAKAIDRADYSAQTELSIATFRKPEAVLFKGQLTTTLSAWVCAQCGYVEFYADSPRSINIATAQ
jgi:predicted nucleic-acid-binding Zn-ribbon protein